MNGTAGGPAALTILGENCPPPLLSPTNTSLFGCEWPTSSSCMPSTEATYQFLNLKSEEGRGWGERGMGWRVREGEDGEERGMGWRVREGEGEGVC